MSNYTIDWQSNNTEGIPGKAPISLPQKTSNSTATSITLTGRGLLNYGEIQQENYIRLMENFASATAPLHPTVGQIWFDSTNNKPWVYDFTQVWIPFVVGDVNGFITLAGDPTQPLHPVTKQFMDATLANYATKAYVDSLISGLIPQSPVAAATTAPITLSGLQTVDAVVLTAGQRVLVKDQADQKTNGVYVVAVGAWVRSPEFDGSPSTEVVTGMSFPVGGGTINNGRTYSVATPNPITIGTSNIVFQLVIDDHAYVNRPNNFSVTQVLGAGLTSTGSIANTGSLTNVGTTYSDGSLVQKAITLDASGGSAAVNLATGDLFKFTVAGATSVSFANPQPSPRTHVFLLEVTNGGLGTITWPSTVQWNAGTPPTLKTSGVDVLGFTTCDGGTYYRGVLIAGGATGGGGGGGTYTLPVANAFTLGGIQLGNTVHANGAGTLNTYTAAVALTPSAGPVGIDLSLGEVFSITPTGTITFSILNPIATGRVNSFILEITNGGAFALTWPAAVAWVGGVAPTLNVAGKNVIGFFTRDGGISYQAFLIAGGPMGTSGSYVLPIASPTDLGGVKVGAGLTINGAGVLDVVTGAVSYILPTASNTVLGGIKIGSGLSIDGTGVVSSAGGGPAFAAF
jgi:hypothetical protein